MPFVPVPGGVKATIHYLLDGQDVENTLWFVTETGPIDEAMLLDLGGALFDWVTTSLMPQYPEALVANFLNVKAEDVEGGPALDFPLNLTAGGIVEDPLPNEVSLAVSFRTAVSGRGSRGRNYLIVLPRGQVTLNTVSNAYANNFLTIYMGLNTAIATTGFIHCVAHRYSGFTIVDGKKVPTPLATGLTYGVTAYLFSDYTVDAQRRRGPGRGR